MKATIDIPDELYRQVKSKSALRGQAVREVAINLFQNWVLQADEPSTEKNTPPAKDDVPTWFGSARKYAKHVQQHDMSSIRRSIAKGRVSETHKDNGQTP
jgi:hypothetical protein